jgi:hypothetical protein
MSKLTKISAVLLALGLATTAHAEKISLERMVSQMLAQSVANVQQELSGIAAILY